MKKQKLKMSKTEKKRANERKQELLKNKLKFRKNSVDKGFSVWYHNQADRGKAMPFSHKNLNFGGYTYVNIYGKGC